MFKDKKSMFNFVCVTGIIIGSFAFNIQGHYYKVKYNTEVQNNKVLNAKIDKLSKENNDLRKENNDLQLKIRDFGK